MAGRPPYYNSPEEMDPVIDSYFAECKANNEPITITGLILYLGFCSRDAMADYEKKPLFHDSIKKARLRVESEYEKKLSSQSVTGSIFALKNFGWKDKTEVENSGTMTINWQETLTDEVEHKAE